MKKLILFLSCFSLFVASQAAIAIPLELKTAVTDVSGLVSAGVLALIVFFGVIFAYKAGIGLVMFAGNNIKRFMRGGGGNYVYTDDDFDKQWAELQDKQMVTASARIAGRYDESHADDYYASRRSGASAKQAYKMARHNARQSARDSQNFSNDPSAYKEISF